MSPQPINSLYLLKQMQTIPLCLSLSLSQYVWHWYQYTILYFSFFSFFTSTYTLLSVIPLRHCFIQDILQGWNILVSYLTKTTSKTRNQFSNCRKFHSFNAPCHDSCCYAPPVWQRIWSRFSEINKQIIWVKTACLQPFSEVEF